MNPNQADSPHQETSTETTAHQALLNQYDRLLEEQKTNQEALKQTRQGIREAAKTLKPRSAPEPQTPAPPPAEPSQEELEQEYLAQQQAAPVPTPVNPHRRPAGDDKPFLSGVMGVQQIPSDWLNKPAKGQG